MPGAHHIRLQQLNQLFGKPRTPPCNMSSGLPSQKEPLMPNPTSRPVAALKLLSTWTALNAVTLLMIFTNMDPAEMGAVAMVHL